MTYALGRQEQVWLKTETAYDTVPGDASTAAFDATDAAKLLALSVEPSLEVRPRDDKADSNSVAEPLSLRQDGSWSLRARMIPSGIAGTAPDLHAAFTVGYGAGVASGSTVDYTLAKNKTASLTILRKAGVFSELVTGCTVDRIRVRASGDDLAEVEFAGAFADLIRTGQVTAPDGASASATSFDVDRGANLQVASVISIGSEDIRIDAMSGDSIASCTRGWHGTTPAVIASGATAAPYAPGSQTTAGSPSVGISGSLTLDGQVVTITGFEHVVDNALTVHKDHYGTSKPDGFSDGSPREVTFQLDARVDEGMIAWLNKGASVTAVDIACVLGTGTGKIWTFDYDNAIGEVTTIDVPSHEEATVSLNFRAYKNAADEDEHQLTIS